MEVDRLMRAATAYTERGWFVFVTGTGKVPFANCPRCPAGAHSGLQCPYSCLRCHGHLAATRDTDRLRAMIWGVGGECCLGLDCGRSGLVVVDAEGDDRAGYGMTGLEVLDQWESFTQGRSLPVTGLRAVTGSGGVHLYFRGDAGSANRTLPNVDVKARGGFVVAPPAAGRRWEDWNGEPGIWDAGALPSAGTGGAGKAWSGAGTRLRDMTVDGTVPGGLRYEYTRNLVYKLRKNGVCRADAERIMREAWETYAQPPAASYEMPWTQVLYELDRAWARVEPERLASGYETWMKGRGSV